MSSIKRRLNTGKSSNSTLTHTEKNNTTSLSYNLTHSIGPDFISSRFHNQKQRPMTSQPYKKLTQNSFNKDFSQTEIINKSKPVKRSNRKRLQQLILQKSTLVESKESIEQKKVFNRSNSINNQAKNKADQQSVQYDSSQMMKKIRYDKQFQQQVLTHKISKVQNKQLHSFFEFYNDCFQTISDAIQQENHQELYSIFHQLIEQAILADSVTLLAHILLVIAHVIFNLGDINRATFLFDQLRILTSYAGKQLQELHTQSLVFLGKCAQKYGMHKQAIQILKKSIQYTWLQKNKSQEVEIYYQIALSYFYMGILNTSLFYQQRSLLSDYEADNSPIKKLSDTFLSSYIQKINNIVIDDKISKALLNKLSLPLDYSKIYQKEIKITEFLISSQMQQSQSQISKDSSEDHFLQKIDSQKVGLYKIIGQGIKIIDDLLKEPEYEFEIYTPRYSVLSQTNYFDCIKSDKFLSQQFHDQRLNKFNLSDIGVINKHHRQEELDKTDKYKLPLDKQIEIRVKKKFNLAEQFQKVDQQVRNNINFKTQRMHKIYVNHQNGLREQEHKNKCKKFEQMKAINIYIETLWNLVEQNLKN